MGLFSGGKGRKAYALHLKGNKASEAGRYQEAAELHKQAMELYQQALDAGDKTPRYMMAYGVLLMRFKKFEEAHDLMLKTDKAPGITREEKRQLRLNFAVCEWKRGQLDHAIELMKSVGSDGMTSMIYGSLGYMLIEKAIQTGDFTEAEAFNKEAYEYDEEDAVVLDNLGQLYLNMGQRDKALDYFKRAHEQKSSQVDTLYYLARLALEDGDKQQARKYLEDALEGNYSALCTTTREQAQQLLDTIE